jgi:hypothetical protein
MAKLIAIALLFFPLLAFAQQVELGPPPAGYAWYSAPDADVFVLRPDGWFTKSESESGTSGLFVSKEDIATGGRFETGLTLNFVRGVKHKTGLTSSQYAIAFLSKALDGNEELTSFAKPGNGMLSIGLRLKNEHLGKVIHYFLVANDKVDTLHIFSFEAPIAEWEGAWKIGEPVFRNLRLVFPR